MEPIMHLLIPLAFLLALFPKINKKQAILFSILAILPDADFLIGHRGPLHSIFALTLISIIFYLFIGKLPALLSLYYYGSHLLFDMTGPGVAFLYPLTDKLFKLKFILSTNTTDIFDLKSTTSLTLNAFTEATKSQIVPFFTEYSLLILVLFVILIIIKLSKPIFKH